MFLEGIFTKKIIEQPLGLFVKQSAIHGRGVFSSRDIQSGELIEKAPLLLIRKDEYDLLKQTDLHDYYFLIKNSRHPLVIGFGYTSLYNHSCPSSATYVIDLSRKIITIKAFRYIRSNEEITINYNGHPEDNSPVAFTIAF